VRLVLEGKARGIALKISAKNGYLEAAVQTAREMLPLDSRDSAFVALYREARERAAELGRKLGLPDETVDQVLAEVDEPGRLADVVAGYIDIPFAERQALLETLSVEDRLRRVLVHVQKQIDVLSVQEDIQSKVKEELGGRQREMYLREQLRAIQKELGEGEGSDDDSLKELKTKLDALELPEELQGSRSRMEPPDADRPRVVESQVIRTSRLSLSCPGTR
jgi:ATP-dependent Lon protease